MINDLDEVQFAYLLAPTFQFVNSAGKPITGGWMEVYIHGTRTKYYCVSDWDGTLHPFKIPLDSLGSNIVLASPSNAYDVYVYNRFGSLIMSRYNVIPSTGGASGVIPSTITIVSDDDTVNVSVSGSTYNLSIGDTVDKLNTVSGDVEELKAAIASGIDQVQTDWEQTDSSAVDYIKNKPDLSIYATNELVETVSGNIVNLVNEGDTNLFNTISSVSSNLETEIENVYDTISNVSGDIITTVNVVSGALQDEMESVSGDLVELINTVSSEIPEQEQSDWDETDTTSPSYINNKPDLSVYATHSEVNGVSGAIINIVNSVSTTIEGDIDTASGNLVDLIEEVSANIPQAQVQSDWTEDNTSSPAYIKNKPTESTLIAGDNISIVASGDDYVISASGTDLSDYATHTEVNNVSGGIISVVSSVSSTLQGEIENIPEQVNSDWNAVSGKAEILNKPDLSVYATNASVNSVSSILNDKINSVSSAIPDVSEFATHTEVNNVSGAIINVVNNEVDTLNGKIDAVSGAIPDVSSFATRTEVNGVSGVLETEIQIVSAAIPDISDLVDTDTLETVSGNIITTVNNVSSVLNNNIESASGDLVELIATVSSEIPEQAQSNWNETDTSDPSYIQNKPDLSVYATNSDLQLVSAAIPDVSNFSTKTEVNTVSSILENEIQAISGAIPEPFEGYTSPSGTSYIDNVNYTIEQSNSAIGYITTYDWRARWQFPITTVPVSNTGFTPSTKEVKFEISDTINGEIRLANNYEMTDYISGYFNDSSEVIFNIPQSWVGSTVYFYYNGDTSAYQITGYTKDGNPISTEAVRKLAWEDDLITVSATIPDVSDLVSENELVSAINVITSTIPQAQVQSNWAETDSADPSYIQNKPDEINIVAGSGINIVASGTDLVISASATQQVPNVNIVSPSGSIVVGSSIDPITNTKTFSIDVATASGVEYGQFYATNVTGTANLARTKGNLSVNNGKIQLHKGQSYHVTIRGTYTQTTLANELSFFNFIEYVSFRNIAVNVNKTISAGQYWEISYDLYNLSADTDYIVAFNNISNARLSDIFVEVHSLAGGNGQGGSGGGTEYTAGYGIQILNDVISVSGINPQVNADWDAVSGVSQVLNKPDEVEIIAGSGINITETNNQLIISSTVTGGGAEYQEGYGIDIDNNTINVDTSVIPNGNMVSAIASAYASGSGTTYQEGYGIDIDNDTINVNTAVIPNSNMVSAIASAYASGGGGSGVNYNAGDHIDITNNTISVTGITELVAGSNITITMNSDSAVISAAGGQQVQSDWDEWNSSSPAYIKNKPSIPQSPEQSDWNETDPYSLAYIKNKPNITDAYTGASGIAIDDSVISLDEPLGIVAGSGINIVIEGDSAIICVSGVSGGGGSGTNYQEGYGIDITNNTISIDTTIIPDVSAVSAMIGIATASIPAQVNADWSATSGVAEILNKPTEANLLPGSGITISASGSDYVVNTTPIELVASLPANPVSGVLYLIPEA